MLGPGKTLLARTTQAASLWEDDDSIHLEIDAPGVAREDINLTFEKGTLEVRINRKRPEGDHPVLLDERVLRRVGSDGLAARDGQPGFGRGDPGRRGAEGHAGQVPRGANRSGSRSSNPDRVVVLALEPGREQPPGRVLFCAAGAGC